MMQKLDSRSLYMPNRMRNVFWCLFVVLVLQCQSEFNNYSPYLRALENRLVFCGFS